jgi:hypothetical protein
MTYQFLFGQENLDELCKDRKLKTSEIFEPNDYYGQASVLKQYVGLPNWYSLKSILQHGIVYNDFLWEAEAKAALPVFLAPTKDRAELFKRKVGKPSFPIGFGFLYAKAIFQQKYEHAKNLNYRSGTVVFPSHSSHHITSVFDIEMFAESLSILPERFRPIVVCIYWKDFLLNRHIEYIKRGFKVVTAGHIYDPMFLFRLYDICRQFKYATSNDIGTHLFASVKSGCSFFYTGFQNISYENPEGLVNPLQSGEVLNLSLRLFGHSNEDMSPEQIQFVDSLIGENYFLKRDALRSLILYSEFCDKFRVGRSYLNSALEVLPTFIHPKRIIPKAVLKFFSFFRRKIKSKQ